jgi:N-acetylglucosaminyl-diphospho-decaprenol L-rhamnosyltransferase
LRLSKSSQDSHIHSYSPIHTPTDVPPRLDIVIVNWNAGALLSDCLESIFASRRDRFELGAIVVVDNASTDGSPELVHSRWHAEVQLIRNAHNLGFARACNIGAQRGRGELLLFLNPDTRLLPETLAGAARALDAKGHDRVGVCGVRLVDDQGNTARSCARFPNWKMFVVASVGLDLALPRWCRSHVMREWDHESSRYVDHVIGAFYLVRRSVFERAGSFDERFFLYLEDLDLSRRIDALGFRTFFCATTHAYHKGGGASRAILARRLFLAQRSRLQYASKHFSRSATVMVAVTTLVVEPLVRLLRACLTLHWRDFWHVVHAYWLLYASLLDPLGRRGVQGERLDVTRHQ